VCCIDLIIELICYIISLIDLIVKLSLCMVICFYSKFFLGYYKVGMKFLWYNFLIVTLNPRACTTRTFMIDSLLCMYKNDPHARTIRKVVYTKSIFTQGCFLWVIPTACPWIRKTEENYLIPPNFFHKNVFHRK
jgi:hypothetical protein